MRGPEDSGEPFEAGFQNTEKIEVARRLFSLSERAGRILDDLRGKVLRHQNLSYGELAAASLEIRHVLFDEVCDLLNITEEDRAKVIKEAP
jgi:hypothetical protein